MLSFAFQYSGLFALTSTIWRFCWRHKWDLPAWPISIAGGFGSAHALRLLSGSSNVVEAYTRFMPWTYLGSLIGYVGWRRRQPESLPNHQPWWFWS